MTRYEANNTDKDGIADYTTSPLLYHIQMIHKRFDKIYDEIANKNCENCRHYSPSDYDRKEEILDQWLCCHLIYAETRDLINFKDFCCNRWESKC